MSLRSAVKALPVIGPLIRKWRAPPVVRSSADYWEQRYRTGGDSGAGSYGRLAEFKAGFLNAFVADREIASVIEFGCGDGAQLTLAAYPRYIGIDVSPSAVRMCRERFLTRPEFRFFHSADLDRPRSADLSMSLDVIYHLVEDAVFETYMSELFSAAERYVVIYASDVDMYEAPHVRHRNFTAWVARHRTDFTLQEVVPNDYRYDPGDASNTSFAEFHIYARTSGQPL